MHTNTYTCARLAVAPQARAVGGQLRVGPHAPCGIQYNNDNNNKININVNMNINNNTKTIGVYNTRILQIMCNVSY